MPGLGRVTVRPEPRPAASPARLAGLVGRHRRIIDDMASLGFDVAVTRHGDDGTPWRALSHPSSFIHERGLRPGVGGDAVAGGAGGGVDGTQEA